MPPKKKRSSKKKHDKEHLTNVDRTFYELTIADINKKLARLRSYVETLNERNTTVEEKLHELEHDRTDVASHLQRVLEQRNETIVTLETELQEINKVRMEEARIAKEKITRLEDKYWAMHDQLFSEIKLLTGKLRSLDEFRLQRQDLYAKLDELKHKSLVNEAKHKTEINDFEQRLVVEKDALKKEVEARLLALSEDFTRSSEIRSAGYTRRLIRENIALQKEIDKLIMSQLKLQLQYNNQKEKHKQVLEQYLSLDQIKIELVRNSVNKIKIIEGLTKNYEKLKVKYVEMVRYRKAYEALHATDDCGKIRHKDALEKINSLTKRMDILNIEKRRNILIHEQHEAEIVRLRGVLDRIKEAIVDAMRAINHIHIIKSMQKDAGADKDTMNDLEESAEQACEAWQAKRVDLLKQLMEIIGTHNDELPKTPSIETISTETTSLYEPGRMGLMKRPDYEETLMDTFKKNLSRSSETISIELVKRVSKEVVEIIPTDPIIDVEWGSTLYVSETYSALPEIQEEPLEYDEGEASSSSVSVQRAPSVKSEIQIPLLPPETSIKPTEDEFNIHKLYFNDEEEEEMGEEEEFELTPWLS